MQSLIILFSAGLIFLVYTGHSINAQSVEQPNVNESSDKSSASHLNVSSEESSNSTRPLAERILAILFGTEIVQILPPHSNDSIPVATVHSISNESSPMDSHLNVSSVQRSDEVDLNESIANASQDAIVKIIREEMQVSVVMVGLPQVAVDFNDSLTNLAAKSAKNQSILSAPLNMLNDKPSEKSLISSSVIISEPVIDLSNFSLVHRPIDQTASEILPAENLSSKDLLATGGSSGNSSLFDRQPENHALNVSRPLEVTIVILPAINTIASERSSLNSSAVESSAVLLLSEKSMINTSIPADAQSVLANSSVTNPSEKSTLNMSLPVEVTPHAVAVAASERSSLNSSTTENSALLLLSENSEHNSAHLVETALIPANNSGSATILLEKPSSNVETSVQAAVVTTNSYETSSSSVIVPLEKSTIMSTAVTAVPTEVSNSAVVPSAANPQHSAVILIETPHLSQNVSHVVEPGLAPNSSLETSSPLIEKLEVSPVVPQVVFMKNLTDEASSAIHPHINSSVEAKVV